MFSDQRKKYEKLERYHGQVEFSRDELLDILSAFIPAHYESVCNSQVRSLDDLKLVEQKRGFNNCINELERIYSTFKRESKCHSG